jgi:hypothetical protein
MLAIPPSGASSNIALWRANSKPPIELVVADLITEMMLLYMKICYKGVGYEEAIRTVFWL